MNKKIIIKVDESGYPTIEKITGDFSPYELLHRVVMAAMLKVYDETDQMPEEIFTDLSKIGMQFVDVANEELYGEEECEDEDDDKLGIPADIKNEIDAAMKAIINKHREGTPPNSNNPTLN